MIKAFAQKIAGSMGMQLQVDQDRVEIFAYGLEIILGTLVQLAIILLLSLIMGTIKTTMVCLIAFASLRYFIGGAHASTYPGCLIVGVSLLLVLGNLATVDVSLEILTVISVSALLMGIYTIFKWAPAGTEKKQIKDESIRLRQRNKAFFILTMWFFVTMVLIKQELTAYALAVVLGALGSIFIITPWGYRAVKALDNILNILFRSIPVIIENGL